MIIFLNLLEFCWHRPLSQSLQVTKSPYLSALNFWTFEFVYETWRLLSLVFYVIQISNFQIIVVFKTVIVCYLLHFTPAISYKGSKNFFAQLEISHVFNSRNSTQKWVCTFSVVMSTNFTHFVAILYPLTTTARQKIRLKLNKLQEHLCKNRLVS